MANKKNKKNKSSSQKKVVNKLSKENQAVEIAYENNLERISGAILLGVDLNTKNNLKYPCVICNKSVQNNQHGIACDLCGKWCHRKCDAMTPEMYEYYAKNHGNPAITWHCLYCTLKFNHQHIPFTLTDNYDIENTNNSDTMKFCENLPTLEEIHETSKFSSFPKPMEEATLPSNLNSKYHSVRDFQKLKIQKNFNIFHANVNGFESKFDNLHTFLAGAESKMDVVAITETSENKDHSFINNISIDGYSTPLHTPTNSLKGGVAMFINKDFDAYERTELKAQTELYESVWAEIKNKKSKNIVVGCIYRHPKSLKSDISEFNKYLDATLSKLVKEKKEIYLCGDFNIDLLRMNDFETHLEFYTLLNSHGLLPFIVQPSRVVTNQVPSLIDNIFSTNISDAVSSGNIYLTLSEHFSQFASVNRSPIDIKKMTMYGRNLRNFSENSFRDDVSIQQWRQDTNDPNLLTYDLVRKLDGCAERHAPTQKLTPKEIKLTLKPWITPDIQNLIKLRDRLFERKKRQPENDHVREVYNRVRNRVSRQLEKSKKQHYESYFDEMNSNIKKTWEGIRKIVNVKKSTKFSISHLNVNGKIVDEPVDIANNFNNFFVNVGPETDKTVPRIPNQSPNQFLKNRNQFDFIVAHISEEDIIDIIVALPKKSIGPHSIPINFLKIVADIVAIPLCRIINFSFSQGIFPDMLKIAKVIALFKAGSTEEVNNYRPISLLPIFDKIIEKLMHKQLYAFLEVHDILFKNQFGFRKKCSTAHSLIEITEKIKESIDSGKFGCGIFIDLKKAFDTVNHQILLQKLEHYGIRGTILKWFESYLTDRKQYVFYNGVTSEMKTIACGVPQGSVLGPLLFLLYINDLPNISDKLQFFLFADDTNIYYESKDLKILEKTVNEELKKLSLWLNLNRLALNVAKTNFVIFRSCQKVPNHNVTLLMNKKALQQKDHVKYLGVLLDQHLSWKYHIKSVALKVSRGLGIIAKLKPFLRDNLIRTIYFSVVYSHLYYGIQAWGSADPTTLNKLVILQNKAVRILSGKQYFQIYGQEPGPLPSSEPLYKKLEILKINDIFELSISNFVYSTLTFESPAIFNNWFQYTHEIHEHTTRASTDIIRESYFDVGVAQQSFTLHTKGASNIYGGKMIQVSGPLIWNRIPEDIQQAGSILTFKKHLKLHIFGQYRGDPEDNSLVNTNRNNDNIRIINNSTRTNANQRWRQNVNQPFVSRWNQQN